MAIHQLLAGFMPGDAISNYALELRKIFRGWGEDSRIFVASGGLDPRAASRAEPLGEHRRHSGPGNILVYHFSIGSSATDYFRTVPDTKVIIYHNITPARYFALVRPELAEMLDRGRRELFQLAPVTDLALGVSEYNRRELEAAGFARTGTVPLTVDWSSLEEKPDRSVLFRHRRGRNNLLFVGRLVPNKKLEDLLKVFYYYKPIKPAAKLFLVGNHQGEEQYLEFLRSVIQELGLKDVVFSGHVSHAQLLAYYQLAGAYLCLSEHEGFCLPLMEAMRFRIPVLAYAAAAVPDTLDGAGVLIREKNFPEIAEMAALLQDDPVLRRRIVEEQDRRLERFRSLPLDSALRALLRPSASLT